MARSKRKSASKRTRRSIWKSRWQERTIARSKLMKEMYIEYLSILILTCILLNGCVDKPPDVQDLHEVNGVYVVNADHILSGGVPYSIITYIDSDGNKRTLNFKEEDFGFIHYYNKANRHGEYVYANLIVDGKNRVTAITIAKRSD